MLPNCYLISLTNSC